MTEARKSAREAYKGFVHPLVLFAERVATAGQQVAITQDALKTSRDMIIDYIAISEESLSTGVAPVGAGQTYLHYLDINWGIVEGARWLPGNSFGNVETFHNYVADRSSGGVMAFANVLAAWGGLRWKHSEPWIYNPIDTLNVDMVRPAIPAPIAATAIEPIRVSFAGIGRKTGLRRNYDIQGINIAASGAIPAVQWAQSFGDNQRANNPGAEPFYMTDTSIEFTNRQAAAPGWNADLRLLNHYRMRVVPSIGDSWSHVPIPLAFYGVDQSVPYRVAYHKPEGGPIMLEAGRSLTFDVVNNGPQPTNIQVALIGRIYPGVGSVE